MISEKEIIKPEFLNKINPEIEDIINEDRFRDAYDLAKDLSSSISSVKDFKEKNYDLYLEYKKIINRLKWIGLPIMVPDNVIKMFQYHFKEIFKIPEFDLWSKLRTVLLGIVILEDRDKFKKQLKEALQKNEEKLTGKNLIIGEANKEPTIANWLIDYNSTLGAEQTKSLARTEYFVNGKNIKNLSDEEKNRVKLLFDLYEKLKLSSYTFEGLENEVSLDENGATGVIKDGVFEPFKQTEKQKQTWQMIQEFLKKRNNIDKSQIETVADNSIDELSELKRMLDNYSAGSFERKAIEEEIGKINAK